MHILWVALFRLYCVFLLSISQLKSTWISAMISRRLPDDDVKTVQWLSPECKAPDPGHSNLKFPLHLVGSSLAFLLTRVPISFSDSDR